MSRPSATIHDEMRETSALAIAVGIVLAIALGAANVYVGLAVGMTVSASIPAAVVSMAILRGVFRRGSILENNIAQTIASTGESLAAGAIFSVPALILAGAWTEFHFWPTTFIILLGGMLGVLFMVPMRRALIIDRKDLSYPEGVACAEVLIAGQQGGSGAKLIGIGLAVGAVFKFFTTGVGVIKATVEGAVATSRSVFYFGSDMSPMLIAVGYIVRFRVAVQIFIGGSIGWLVAMPLLGPGADSEAVPVDRAWAMWDEQIRFIGVGAMLIGGLHSIWNVRGGIQQSLAQLARRNDGAAQQPDRTERDLPLQVLGAALFLTLVGTVTLYQHLIGSLPLALGAAVIMVGAAFLFVAVASYIAGLVGSSNSPVSGMTICTLLLTAGLMVLFGISGAQGVIATLGVAGVVCCAACTAGDISQDLKTGALVGATPARQQWVEMLGVVVTAFIFAPVLTLLHNSYGIGDQLRAPQASLFASLANGFFGDGDLPWSLVAIGCAIGLTVVGLDNVLQRGQTQARLLIMPIAVGIYLPFALSVPIVIGGLLHRVIQKRQAAGATNEDTGVLFGSGVIAGEALMGIGLAIPLSLKIAMPQWPLGDAFSVAALLAVLYIYYRVAASRSSGP